MECRSTARYMRMSASKVRLVANLIRGKSVEQALQALRLYRGRGARMVEKTLHAAVAAAVEQHDADADDLRLGGVWVDGGPQRSWRLPRSRGMWTPLIKRTCHITVVVTDEAEEEAPASRGS